MIKKIRGRFIIVAMSAIFIVLFAIMGIINATAFYKINTHADEVLAVLTANGGTFPKQDKPDMPDMPRGEDGLSKDKIPPPHMSPEAPYETRYFTVLIGNTGEVVATNTGFIAAISTADAADYAKKVYLSGKTRGFEGKYKYCTAVNGDETLLIFLDCTRDLSTFYSFLETSLLVSFAGILSVLLLVLIFSKIAVKPIAESYEKQKRFITDAGHEIKTPLTIIDASTEVLELENGENEWTQNIKGQVNRLSALTASLISLSRMDEGGTTLQKTEFSLSDAVCETMNSFESLAKTAEKSLTLNISAGISYNGNEAAIRQLISILADNGIKYTNARGEIVVSLEKQHSPIGHARLSFYNTVEEIEQGDLSILFERFYRRDTSRSSETGGYGIGLSVAKAIIDFHKGKISAKSLDGKSILITVII